MSKAASDAPARRAAAGEVDPFLRDFFDNPVRWPSLFRGGDPERSLARWAPAMDLSETKDGYAITVELAGTKPEDIQIECHEHQLTIKGEKRSEREEKDEHRHYTERTFGSFSRSIRLPPDASDEVKAKFNEGVLTVDVPKVEEKKPRSVAIES